MCGLVGMAGNIVEQDKKALKYLMIFDSSRGEDSTGLAVVHENNNDIAVHKKVGGPHILFNESPVFDNKNIYSGVRGKVFIGHNRAATRGKVNDENAHPFHHNTVVGAHNGTLVSTFKLEDANKFDVDSEAIFYNLDKYDVESVVPNIYGAYALTWYDKVNDTVYVIRNKERPLYWCRRKDNDVVFWASESWMLTAALDKAGITHSDPVSFEVDTLYSLDVLDCRATAFRKVEWVAEKTIEGYKPAPVKKQTQVRTNGGNTNNVIPFVGSTSGSSSNIFNNSSTRTKDEVAVMKMLTDTEILFRFSEVKKGVSKTEYLSAYPDDLTKDYDIRVFATNDKRWNDWKKKKHGTLFRGKIKRVVENRWGNKKEVYFLIDLRSIREEPEDKTPTLPFDEEKKSLLDSMMGGTVDERYYEGFQGRYLNHKEWLSCTKQGCAGCGEAASEYDCDLVFINYQDFLCGKCVDDYPEYIPTSSYKQ